MSTKTGFLDSMQVGYRFTGAAIPLGAAVFENEALAEAPAALPLRMMNRHGLIAGATGTGKTRTLQLLAEGLSENGVPVLLMDVKGDLSGLAMPGEPSERIEERAAKTGIDWSPGGFPVEFLTLSREKGTRLRATVAEFGPVLFSKMLGLNETQSSLVALVFKFCDDKRLPLLDLKDFKKVLGYMTGEVRKEVTAEYGLVPTQSSALIVRKLIELEQQGAERFFGERSFEVDDLCREVDGFGVISILRLSDIQDRPKLFSSFMLQMLGEIYATFPEVGDAEKPKLVIFIDEAHLVFEEAEKSLLDQIEMTIKLIRSKGVGIFFCTQSPADIPEDVLGQLGMKVQHALRAFTAKDRRGIKLVAENYPESEFYDVEEMLTSLGIGEALVTVLDERGAPTPLAATLLCAPRSRMGILSLEEVEAVVARSPLIAKYNEEIDEQSAYEILGGKLAEAAGEEHSRSVPAAGRRTYTPGASAQTEALRDALGQERPAPATEAPYARKTAPAGKSTLEEIFSSPIAKSMLRSAMVNITGTVTRSLLGVLGLGGRRRRR